MPTQILLLALAALLVYALWRAQRDTGGAKPRSLTKRVARHLMLPESSRASFEPLRGWGRVAGVVALIGIIVGWIVLMLVTGSLFPLM